MKKVCHMTSAHRSDDTRIFHKECVSLANAGYEVYLVAQGESFDREGVQVVGIGDNPKSRLRRMLGTARKVYKTAIKLDADIYHIHDPELLPYVVKLKRQSKKVIYDIHEDYPLTISIKRWVPKPFRGLVSYLFSLYEKHICKKLDGVIVCYHWTKERLQKYNNNIDLVFNFPRALSLDDTVNIDFNNPAIAYAGGISSQWNIDKAIEAIDDIPGVTLLLAGSPNQYISRLEEMPQWQVVRYHGYVSHKNVHVKLYSKAFAGIALLDYIPQCKHTVGNLSNTKLFEIMYAGLPVICTNFDLWKTIIEEYQCGICVDINNVHEIKDAIEYLLNNQDKARLMGKNGRKAIEEKYNWQNEFRKLSTIYKTL